MIFLEKSPYNFYRCVALYKNCRGDYMKKQLLSALLAGCLVVGCIGPVSAEEITTSGGIGETPVTLTAEAMTFSVTVPMALSVGVAADGTVTTADNAKIINNSSGPVKVESVTAAAVAPWEMVAWSETDNLSGEKVGSKKFALSIQKAGVSADGSCGAVFDSIAANGELPFEYAAHIAPQATAITAEDNEQMARVVFTIGWDEIPVDEYGNPIGTVYTDYKVTSGSYALIGFTGERNENLVIPATFVFDNRINYKVTSIEKYAFINCKKLTSVTIPDSVTSIKDSAFENCTSLTSVTIPDSVTSINASAFNGCTSLTSVTIPDSVTKISNNIFTGCSSLTSITIPDGVTSIGFGAFWNCSSLTSITIPDGVTSIDDNAFYGCSSLTSITIPDGVTSIKIYAFNNCTNLTSITIPDGVTSIGEYAFNNCPKLTSITYKGTEYKSVDEFKTAFNAIEGNNMV